MQLTRIYNSKRKFFNNLANKSKREVHHHNNYLKRSIRKSGEFNTIEKDSKLKLEISRVKKKTFNLSPK
jgi:hypothetical protein